MSASVYLLEGILLMMCGRYARRGDKQKIAEAFQVWNDLAEMVMPPWDFNIAPTTTQPVIREMRDSTEREMVLMRWGMVPFFTKDLAEWKGKTTFNARAETAATTKMWKEPLKKRRCLVPASAFYEWPKDSSVGRKPYTFEVSGGMFAFAGLWDAWKDAEGKWLQSFTILTTEANELMAAIHPRMPVILHPQDYDRWLDRGETERLPLDLLKPYEAEGMVMSEANPAVNNARNNGEELLRAPQGLL